MPRSVTGIFAQPAPSENHGHQAAEGVAYDHGLSI